MLHKNRFYFESSNAVAGTFNYVVVTACKPEVAVFVTPGVIACVVITVMHNSFCAGLISKVFHKEAREVSVRHIYNNFTNFTVFYFVAFFVNQSYIVVWCRFSKTAWFDSFISVVKKTQSCFCLTKTFADFFSGNLLPFVEYFFA